MATQEKVVIPVLISAVLAGQGPMKDSRSRKLVPPPRLQGQQLGANLLRVPWIVELTGSSALQLLVLTELEY